MGELHENWDTAMAVVLATLKDRVASITVDLDRLAKKVDETIGRIQDGVMLRLSRVEQECSRVVKLEEDVRRLTIAEQDVRHLAEQLANYRSFAGKIGTGVIMLLIAAFLTNYVAMSNRSVQLEAQIQRLERAISKPATP